jgi:excinuclease ABC subunit A
MMILAPYVQGRKGEHREIFEKIFKDGFVRVRVDGEVSSLDGESYPKLEKNKKHTVEAVVDRLVTGKVDSSRLSDSIELALKHGDGTITVLREDKAEKGAWIEDTLSEDLACLDCGVSFTKLAPRNFSFNSPYGACSECHGLGTQLIIQPELVVPDKNLSIKKGAIPALRRGPRRLIMYYNHLLICLGEHYGIPDLMKIPFKDIPEEIQGKIFYGTGKEDVDFSYRRRNKLYKMVKPFDGVCALLEKRYRETESDAVRERIRKLMTPQECPKCNGARLNPNSLAVTVGGENINTFNKLPITDALDFIKNLKLNEEDSKIAAEIVKEVTSRLYFLIDVGLGYLTLSRESGTLSGGEAQRIRLATQLGCGLVGVLYILDEPSIGLHQRDNDKLLATLTKLRDIGNTVVVVEHDLDTINRADYILDLGPGAGRHGGEIVAYGSPDNLTKFTNSLTAQYIQNKKFIPVPKERKKGNGDFIEIKGAELNNLKKINVKFPLGTFTCVTGVSGSGKSSLINGILKKAIDRHFDIGTDVPGKHKEVKGLEHLGKAIVIDQTPIGRTPRSNPATYTDAFSLIRKLFAELQDSKLRGYKPGRFSFNVKGGRCEECKGDGIKKIEMQFLPDVFVTCSKCNGKRFNKETLNIRYKKKNIADVLEMTVDEALEFFDAIPGIKRKLQTLADVGLGYLHLGQPATTLSGGEAQRVKLATELSKLTRGHTLYILDEPTTGLHLADIEQLMEVLIRLREQGNTILVIEHNLDVIKVADYIIDLGPEGGDGGGKLLVAGTPEKVAKCKASYTGHYLKELL